jgi:WD repeat-containing protein 23
VQISSRSELSHVDTGTATSAEVDAQLERLLTSVPMDQLLRMFGAQTRILQEEEEEESDDTPISGGGWFAKVTEPQEAGVKLLNSSDFGRVRNRLDDRAKGNIYSRLRQTTLHPRSVHREDLAYDLIPNTHGTAVASYSSNIYCGQYSLGGCLPCQPVNRLSPWQTRPCITHVAKVTWVVCAEFVCLIKSLDFRLFVYDTTAPLRTYTPRPQRPRLRAHYYQEEDGHSTTMPTLKSTALIHGNWTITDTHLSPDNQR